MMLMAGLALLFSGSFKISRHSSTICWPKPPGVASTPAISAGGQMMPMSAFNVSRAQSAVSTSMGWKI